MTLPASGPLSLNDIQGEFGGTNPIGMNEYYAGGGLVPAGTTGTYGAVPSSGALSVQNFYGTSNFIPVYIEDVFSTYLYTGNGSTQTITNGIDLAGKGGLVWTKCRSVATDHSLVDTVRGADKVLHSESTAAQVTYADITAFNASGYGINDVSGWVNSSGRTYASWTFRKQPKFFDVVTYTGNGTAARAINHNLGSTPGCMFVKRVDDAGDWRVYHRGCSTNKGLVLNDTGAETTSAIYWFGNEVNVIPPTSTQFTVNAGFTNINGATYVAYIFAHNAGGFGLTGTDNVISCGSFTADALEKATVTLGYEPQWLLAKPVSTTGDWLIRDNMRGFPVATDSRSLAPNTSAAETNGGRIFPTATGFEATSNLTANATYIYIAIRRGPMKVPTSGTSVFIPVTATPSGATTVTTNFPVDLAINAQRDSGTSGNKVFWDRLRGSSTAAGQGLFSNLTNAEVSYSGNGIGLQSNTTIVDNFWNTLNTATTPVIYWNFRRAPGFFDEVCYTGNGPGTQVVSHNLAAVPELVINKTRSAVNGWTVFQGSTTSLTGFLRLNANNAQGGDTLTVSSTSITADSTIGFGMNTSGTTYVTYLFASVPGVSKVGRYTGTGTTQTINCGFTAGSRFVLIKRFDSTGDWYVWDSARGIVAGDDPYLLLNSTAAEVTNTDFIDTAATGFEISSTAPAAINASGGTFIFLAIA